MIIPKLIIFLLLLSIHISSVAQVYAQGNESNDVLVLQLTDLKILLKSHGGLKSLASWQNSTNVCATWRGVTCDAKGKLIGLDLSSMSFTVNLSKTSLEGQTRPLLPPGLRNLSLSNNNFTGSIQEFVRLFIPENGCLLENLDLSRNSLSGDPNVESLCGGTIRELNLSHNFLTGEGDSWTSLPRLRSLDISHNSFTGAFRWLGLPGAGGSLALSHNQFTRLTIPCLNSLDASQNRLADTMIFSSPIPCPYLKILNLASNNFPTSQQNLFQIFSLASSLEWLDASNNSFTGDVSDARIPDTLRSLDLSSNRLTLGEKRICSPDSALSSLVLSGNNLTGPIPASILACTNLSVLDLSYNPGLTGPIPTNICQTLPNLQQLIIWRSSLNGQIPLQISTCSDLTVLVLSFNNLNGTIPDVSRLKNLTWLALSSNQLTGTIPPSLGQLKSLTFLELSNNRLTGPIPEEISSGCEGLLWLDLSSNLLIGGVPGRLGPRNGSQIFPNKLLLEDEIAFALSPSSAKSPECNFPRGIGGLLPHKAAARLRCENLRLYPISSYNLSSKPLTSPVLIDLSYNNLTGSIPDQVGEMRDLAMLDIGHNRLNGSIPFSFGHLNNLLLLDLSDNSLTGSIPDSLSNLTFISSLNVSNNLLSGQIPQRGQLTTFPTDSYTGNQNLCGVPLSRCSTSAPNVSDHEHQQGSVRDSDHSRTMPGHFLVATLVSGIIILGLLACWIWWRKFESGKWASTQRLSLQYQLDNKSFHTDRMEVVKRVSYGEVEAATQGFKVLIGSGGSGRVYRGQLSDGTGVAVKKLFPWSLSGMQSEREFTAEMETLGKIEHANLVKLVAYCKWNEERMLIYELMHNGNLEQLLNRGGVGISWEMRKRIAMDAAKGLCFLHHACVPHIIHRDVKSANVLLDVTFQAKVSDFGMARLMRCSSETHLSVTTLSGTPGYVPPEYYQSFRCTRNGDVYSYGVILLELLTRKRPTEKDEFGDNGNLVGWVKARIQNGRPVEALDPELRNSVTKLGEMMHYLKLAAACVDDQPHKRPSMLQLVARFKELSLQTHSE